MLLTVQQPSLSPNELSKDNAFSQISYAKNAKSTGSTSSGYCSSPHDDNTSDESFDGDNKSDVFPGSQWSAWRSSAEEWKPWDSSEHVAHNILSQLFDEDSAARTKSPSNTGSTSSDSAFVWQSSPTSPFSDNSGIISPDTEQADGSAFIDWSKMISSSKSWPQNFNSAPAAAPAQTYNSAPGTQYNSAPGTQYNSAPGTQYNTPSYPPTFNSNNFNQNTAFNNTTTPTPFNYNNNNYNLAPGAQTFNSAPGSQSYNTAPGAAPLRTAPQYNTGSQFNSLFNNNNYNAASELYNQQQSFVKNRRVTEPNIFQSLQQDMSNLRCGTPPNRLYPSSMMFDRVQYNSLAHHKRHDMTSHRPAFSAIDNLANLANAMPYPSQTLLRTDMQLLQSTIEACWDQLRQLNRERKRYEYDFSVLRPEFVRPVLPTPQPKPAKIDTLIQNKQSAHAKITAFIDAIEAVGTSVSMKGVLTHALAGWEHLTKELQILRTQMALRHENATMNATEDQRLSIVKLIQSLELCTKQTKTIRSAMYTMLTLVAIEIKTTQ